MVVLQELYEVGKQSVVSCFQVFGDGPDIRASTVMKSVVSTPARDDVEVNMIVDAGSCFAADVKADIEAVRLQVCLLRILIEAPTSSVSRALSEGSSSVMQPTWRIGATSR